MGVVREVGDSAEWFKALMKINSGARELDQKKKAETPGQGNVPKKLSELHRKLLVGFALIAFVAIGAYVARFHGWPPSKDPADWADFATYLSGTVGVTAVVATLIVLVRTLGQQQALIDSQDQMLLDQKKQIKISEKQLKAALYKEERDFAYANIKDVLPLLLQAYKRSLDFYLEPNSTSGFKLFYGALSGSGDDEYKLENVIKNLGCMADKLSDLDVDKNVLKDYIVQVLGNTQHVCDFLIENLTKNKVLFYYADAMLSETVDNDNWTYWSYIQCCLAFLSGYYHEYDEMPYWSVLREPKTYLNSREPHLQQYYQLGIALR